MIQNVLPIEILIIDSIVSRHPQHTKRPSLNQFEFPQFDSQNLVGFIWKSRLTEKYYRKCRSDKVK